jgi:hypothetical protein
MSGSNTTAGDGAQPVPITRAELEELRRYRLLYDASVLENTRLQQRIAVLESGSALARVEGDGPSFQGRTKDWLLACFGEAISADKTERNHRFLEEALELVQANGTTVTEAYQLVGYVYGRPAGEPQQEVGGVLLTLAALCSANDFDMLNCGEVELARVWTKVEKIRSKQAAKPKLSPLAMVKSDESVWPLKVHEALAGVFHLVDQEPALEALPDDPEDLYQVGKSYIAGLIKWHLEYSGFKRLNAIQVLDAVAQIER